MNTVRAYAVDVAQHAADHGAQTSLYASDEWATYARDVLEELIELGRPFTVEEITAIIGRPPSSGAVGGLIRRAAHAGRIRCIGYQPSTRLQARGRILRVWEATT